MDNKKFSDVLTIMEILDQGKNRKKFQNVRAMMNIKRMSKDPQLMRKIAFYNILENLAPDENFKKNINRFLPPKEKQIKNMTSLSFR